MNRRHFLEKTATVWTAEAICPPHSGAVSFPPERDIDSTSMPKRPLGHVGVEMSILALGGVSGMQLPLAKDHDPAALAEAALDTGISYFDTAPSHNNGRSETNFGQVLARRRHHVFLACKTAYRTYDGTMRSVEQSLKRLRTDHFDTRAYHRPWTPSP